MLEVVLNSERCQNSSEWKGNGWLANGGCYMRTLLRWFVLWVAYNEAH